MLTRIWTGRGLWRSSLKHPLRKYVAASSSSLNDVQFDVAVIGGGHAGSEAAAAAARMGAKTVLITHKINTVGAMSCNPSFGGIGKGQLIKEIDALDGVCGKMCDQAGIQFTMLNTSKGQAVQGPRAQMDRELYRNGMRELLLEYPNLTLCEASVEDIELTGTPPFNSKASLDKPSVRGVLLGDGKRILANSIIITTGTFLRGEIHIGLTARPAGRAGDEPAVGLAKTLEDFGFMMSRMKTGTPPRLDARTINYEGMDVVKGNKKPVPFSFMNDTVANANNQIDCFLTRTNEKMHNIVLECSHLNLHIRETVNGPRYCPSLESKIEKFVGKTSHQIWLEPEGYDSHVIYPAGISMTMPEEYQTRAINAVKGLENAKLLTFGYGVEYDYIDPRELTADLQTKKIKGLFLAGQINGTTGYEEAASQGIVAGINSALHVSKREPFIIDRTDAYIGLLIDDLITHGVSEPYRMFTTRSEYRLSLRADNADFRLTQKGYDVGCVSEERKNNLHLTTQRFEQGKEMLKSYEQTKKTFSSHGLGQLTQDGNKKKAWWYLAHGYTVEDICDRIPEFSAIHPSVRDRLTVEGKYSFHLEKQKAEIDNFKKNEDLLLDPSIDYRSLGFLKDEAADALQRVNPRSLGAASRVRGVETSAVLRLLTYVKNKRFTGYEQTPRETHDSPKEALKENI